MEKRLREAMNHPDPYFPSHRPESTAQNKAMGKKLYSSFASPVFPDRAEEELANQDQICYVEMQFVQQIRSYIGTTSCIALALMTLGTDIKFITA